MNSSRYQETLHVCALEQDLEVLPGGDETEIGEKVLACVSMCNCGSDYFLMKHIPHWRHASFIRARNIIVSHNRRVLLWTEVFRILLSLVCECKSLYIH